MPLLSESSPICGRRGTRGWQRYAVLSHSRGAVLPAGQHACFASGQAVIVGGGKLTYKGKVHDFKIGGLTAGVNVGMSTMSAAGEVYDLTDVANFPGTYTILDASATVGGGVGEERTRRNHEAEVAYKGLQLNAGSATGVTVTMKQVASALCSTADAAFRAPRRERRSACRGRRPWPVREAAGQRCFRTFPGCTSRDGRFSGTCQRFAVWAA